ncbi:MAG TPA: hypothetical protein VE871_13160 [Longimicrobium sp.]|nr:hypothetical protein [Longimicrobium sp.]
MKLIPGLSLGLLLMAAGGCTRWQHVQTMPAPAEPPATLRSARVTPAQGGQRVVLRDVQVTADSVIGVTDGEMRRRVALHRSQVVVLERRVTDRWKTAGASVLALATVYIALVAYYIATLEI